MFGSKACIVSWAEDFLDKNSKGEFICPFDEMPLTMVRVGRNWKFDGRGESWILDVEDLRDSE